MAAAKQEALLRSTLGNRKVLVIHCRRDIATAHELEPHDTEFRHRESFWEEREDESVLRESGVWGIRFW